MRLFVGVELPDHVKAAAAAAVSAVRERVDRAAPHAAIRWVDPANLHITLWFLGEVDDTRTHRLTSVLTEPVRTKPFTVQLDRFGVFPNAGKPRVCWIGLGSGIQELISLHAEVQERVVRLGFDADSRPYSPHLTVARVRDIRQAQVPALRELLGSATLAAEFSVMSLTLFRSRPSAKGSRYESLLRVPLQ